MSVYQVVAKVGSKGAADDESQCHEFVHRVPAHLEESDAGDHEQGAEEPESGDLRVWLCVCVCVCGCVCVCV